MQKASQVGYIDVAFGLRLRTLALKNSTYPDNLSIKASEEARTAGNAMSQSYGLLNIKALCDFMDIVWNSQYKYLIKPVCSIHDANYFEIPNTIGAIKFVNDNLIACMEWQDLPELKHDSIHLGGELDVFYSGWDRPITIPNSVNSKEIKEIILREVNKYDNK